MIVIEKELKLILNKSSSFIHIITLFIIMMILSSFAVKNTVLAEAKATLIWICATFTLQVSMHNLFENDYNDGTLEQIFIHSYPSGLAIFFKILAHWLCFGLPIVIISPIINVIILGSNLYNSLLLALALLFSTIEIVFISAVGYALTIGCNNSAAISQVLVLPIMIPIFICFQLGIQVMQVYNINLLLIRILIFIVFVVTSEFTAHVAVKFATQHA